MISNHISSPVDVLNLRVKILTHQTVRSLFSPSLFNPSKPPARKLSFRLQNCEWLRKWQYDTKAQRAFTPQISLTVSVFSRLVSNESAPLRALTEAYQLSRIYISQFCALNILRGDFVNTDRKQMRKSGGSNLYPPKNLWSTLFSVRG